MGECRTVSWGDSGAKARRSGVSHVPSSAPTPFGGGSIPSPLPALRRSKSRLREVRSPAQGHRAGWGLDTEHSSPRKSMHIEEQQPWHPWIPSLTMTPAAHTSEGDSESYIPGCSQNPFTFLSEPMTSPNMHPSPLFSEATAVAPMPRGATEETLPLINQQSFITRHHWLAWDTWRQTSLGPCPLFSTARHL